MGKIMGRCRKAADSVLYTAIDRLWTPSEAAKGSG